MNLMSGEFWSQALQRAVRTFAQTAIAAIGVGTTNLFSADLKNVLALSVSAAVCSILMSLDRSTAAPGATTVIEERVEIQPAAAPAEIAPLAFHGCGESLR